MKKGVKALAIYMDNAATTYPKPEIVYEKMDSYLRDIGVSAGRGAYHRALKADRLLFRTRRSLGELFGIEDCSRIVFTKNVTESLNLALKGLLKRGDHVITSSMEHNAMVRPLVQLKKRRGIEVTSIPCSCEGVIDLKALEESIKENTRLIAITHASNLLGTIVPLQKITSLGRKYGLLTLVDTAQTAGNIPIHVEEMGIPLLAFTGHKGLFGPPGTGGLYVHREVEIEPLIEGGTGGDSYLETMPTHLPDLLEAGTLNSSGLVGLGAGVEFILKTGVEKIRDKERELTQKLLLRLMHIDGIEIYGPLEAEKRVPLVSFNLREKASHEVAYLLDQLFGIMVRAGIHCTPKAHQLCGTEKRGAVRVGLSYFNKEEEIEILLKALKEIKKKSI